jgi:hypothetical protein
VSAFPETFAALEPFADWALPTERQRHERKSRASFAELRAFYDTMLAALPGILEHLNTFELAGLPAPERRLLDLSLATVEAAMAVEMFSEVNPPYLMPVERFEPVHDLWTR